MQNSTVSAVESPARALTGLKSFAAHGAAYVRRTAPASSGISTVRTRGFASDRALRVSPWISCGAKSGMKTTVPTAAAGMKAPAKSTSPRAFSTIGGRNGAHGARLVRSTTAAKGSARGRTRVIR